MSSRSGPRAVGTDGSDFSHRQRVASHYQTSALNKSRLKFCIFLHILVAVIMLIRMSQDILDRLDIFVLELEELEIPKPMRWEWIWLFSTLLSYFGMTGIRRNKVSNLQLYFSGIIMFSMGPTIYAFVLWFPEFILYVQNGLTDEIYDWQGLPLAGLWYLFLTICLQVHSFTIYFTYQLLQAWKISTKKSK